MKLLKNFLIFNLNFRASRGCEIQIVGLWAPTPFAEHSERRKEQRVKNLFTHVSTQKASNASFPVRTQSWGLHWLPVGGLVQAKPKMAEIQAD